MNRTLRNLLAILSALILLAYSGLVAFLAVSENAMVYVSAGEGKRGRPLPADDAGIPWDSLRVRAADEIPVFLLESRVDSQLRRPWAIFFHGNAGMVGSRSSVERYQLLRDAGFNVLAVEYRGYGASAGTGRASEDGIYADARAALAYLTDSLRVASTSVVAYGWSLGSGPATRLATEAKLGALITEGAFTSLPDVGAELYPWVPVRLVMRNRFDNAALAPNIAVPWLVFHGKRDSEIPFAHSEALVAANSVARLVPLEVEHGDGVIGDREVPLTALRALAQGIAGKGP